MLVAFFLRNIAMNTKAANGLNCLGKPYSPSFDPHYKMKHKVGYGHLRVPYPTTMRFVGDEPRTINPRKRNIRHPKPMPLLEGLATERADHARATAANVLAAVIRVLRRPKVRDAIVDAVSTEFAAIIEVAAQTAAQAVSGKAASHHQDGDAQ
jgi:hypothetical protein